MSVAGVDIVYFLFKTPVRSFFRWRFNIETEGNPFPKTKDPYLLLGNHVTNEDPIMSSVYANRLIRFIAGDANHDHWLKKVLLTLVDSIPFTKNAGDAKSIRALVRHVRSGHSVGLYPEGGRNWDGATDSLVPSTGKLVKLLKVPVYAVILKGGYLSRPRWAAYPRRGRLVMEVKQLLGRDAIGKKTPEEIQALLERGLAHNEFTWQQKHAIPFRGKNLAEHIERLLYVCPHCLAVNSIRSERDQFICLRCQKRYGIDQYGQIHGCSEFKDTVSWNRWQRRFLPGLIAKGFRYDNEQIKLATKEIGSRRWSKTKTRLTFLPDRIRLTGNDLDEEIMLSHLSGLSITFKDLVEFYRGKTKYRLLFDPKAHMSVKLFYDLMEELLARQQGGNGPVEAH